MDLHGNLLLLPDDDTQSHLPDHRTSAGDNHLANLTAAGGEDNFLNYTDFTQLPEVRQVFIAFYVVIIILTVTGNALVIYMVVGRKKMHNSVNYLICNLAVSDVLVGAFVAPVKLLEIVSPDALKLLQDPATLCTALSFTQSMAVFSTILTLLVISLERYFVIVHPLRARQFNSRFRTKLYIGLTWLLAMALGSPNLIGSEAELFSFNSTMGKLDVMMCITQFNIVFRKIYFAFLFIVVYCVPMLIIFVTSVIIVRTLIRTGNHISAAQDSAAQRHTENRRKVAAMMIVVSMGFAICWSPYFIVTFFTEHVDNFFEQGHFFFSMHVINILGITNSCLNPIIYLTNDRFREEYKAILYSCACCWCIRMGIMPPVNIWRQHQHRSTLRTTFSDRLSTSLRRMRAFSADDSANFHNNDHRPPVVYNRAFSTPGSLSVDGQRATYLLQLNNRHPILFQPVKSA